MAGEWSEFRRYVYGTGLAMRKGEKSLGRLPTHLLLDGGIISVPGDRQREFNQKYAEALIKGTKLFCVEMKTKPSVYMLSEFDLKIRDRPINDEELRLFVRIAQGVVVRAFPDQEHILAVLTAPPKETTLKDGTPVIQSGIHLIWKIPVTLDTAWMLRAWILRELERGTSEIPWAESWQEMYDACIFRDNGLRMVGSNKAIVCPTCKGQSFKRAPKDGAFGQVCSGCQNAGHVDQGRPYSLAFVADADGIPDMKNTKGYQDPAFIVELVELCTIRTQEDETPVTMTGADVMMLGTIEKWVTADRAMFKGKGGAPKKPKKDMSSEEAEKRKEAKRDAMTELSPDSPEYQAIAAYVLTEFNGGPVATHVRKTGAGDMYIINSKCRWCANKGGEHGHSNVYYMLTPKGCVQKCFCAKMQAGGACSNYTSKLHRVPIETLGMLFNEKQLNTRRREEKRLKLAEEVLSNATSFPVPDRDRARPYPAPQPLVRLPGLEPGAAQQQLRRRGIQKKPDYELGPMYDADKFLAAVSGATFNIFQ